MAARFWVSTSSTAWNLNANWALTSGGAGGQTFPVAGDTVTFDSGGSVNCTLTADAACTSVVLGTKTLNLSTFALTCTSTLNVSSTLQMGVSAGTGLTCAGLTFNASSTVNILTTSKINNSSDFTTNGTMTITTPICGIYTQTGSGNINHANGTWLFDSYTLNSGAVATLTTTSTQTWTGDTSTTNVVNGTIGVGTNIVVLGNKATGSISIGVNGDFTGSGTLAFRFVDGCGVTYSRATAFSFTGTYRSSSQVGTYMLPAWDFSNASVLLYGAATGPETRYVGPASCAVGGGSAVAGTLKCTTFSPFLTVGVSTTYNMSKYNPSFVVSGNYALTPNTGTFLYTKGTGTITFIGGGTSIDFGGKSVEAVTINASSGAITKQATVSDGTVTSLTITQGILDIQTFSITSLGLTTVTTGTTATPTGGLKIGVSGGTGLTTAGLTITAVGDNSSVDLVTGSIIKNSVNYSVPNNSVFKTISTGKYYQTGNGNYTSVHTQNRFAYLRIESGATCTIPDGVQSRMTNQDAIGFDIQGTLATGTTGNATIGCGVGGTFTVGANGDVTGAGTITYFGYLPGTTAPVMSYAKTGGAALTFTGAVTNNVPGVALTGNWANAATYNIAMFNTLGTVYFMTGANLTCKDFNVTQPTTYATAIHNEVANISISVSGNINFMAGGGTFVTTWTKGSGTWTLNGPTGTRTFNFQSNAIGPLVINSTNTGVNQLSANVTVDSLTITSGIFDLSTFACTSLGLTSVATNTTASPTGGLKIGVSGGTGLTTVGLTITAAGVNQSIDLQTTSNINNSSNYTSNTSNTCFKTSPSGNYTQTANGTFTNLNSSNVFYNSRINAGVILTSGNTANYLALFSTNNFSNYGTIACPASSTLFIGGNGTFYWDAAATASGLGNLTFNLTTVATIQYQASAAPTVATVTIGPNSSSTRMGIIGDFSNSDVNIGGSSSAAYTIRWMAGTLKCKSFGIVQFASFDANIDCATNNPSFQVSGNVNFKNDAFTYTLTWTKGSGTWTFNGVTQSLDFRGQSIGGVTIDGASGTKTLANAQAVATAATFDSLTINANDVLDIGTQQLNVTNATSIIGTLKIGNSGVGTGFTGNGITINSGCRLDMQQTSIIRNNGNFDNDTAENVFTLASTGKYYQLASAQYRNRQPGSGLLPRWWYFETSPSVAITAIATGSANKDMFFSATGSAGFVLGNNTSITASGSSVIYLGAGSSGVVTIGTGVTLNTSGSCYMSWNVTPTLGTTTFAGLTGNVRGETPCVIPPITIANADYFLQAYGAPDYAATPLPGTITCKSFAYANASTGNCTIDNSTANMNFNVSGNVVFRTVGSVGTNVGTITSWTKGASSTWTMSGSTQNLDFKGRSVGAIVIAGSAGTKTLGALVSIVSSTNTSPIVITANSHNFNTGDSVAIIGHLVNTNANGTWTVTKTGLNTFSLDTSVGNGVGVATGTATYNSATTFDSLTINTASSVFDVGDRSLNVLNATTVTNGSLKMGTTNGTGLVTNGISFQSANSFDAQIGSKVTNNGNYFVGNVVAFLTNRRGILVQGGGAAITANSTNGSNSWYDYTLNVGTTLNLTGSCTVTDAFSNSCIINGNITGNYLFGVGAFTTFTWSANSDFTGVGANLWYNIAEGATINWSRITPITCPTIRVANNSGTNRMIISSDFSLSDIIINGPPSSAGVCKFQAGSLIAKSFAMQSITNVDITIDTSLVTNITISGLINLKNDAMTYVLTWIKSAAPINLTGSSGTQLLDFQGKDMNPLVMNCSGATKSVVGNFSCTSLSGTGGILQSSVAGTPRIVTVTNTGICTGMSFKDISMNAARKINAKSSTNLGNNKGVVFKDTMRAY